jgi:hypothetical protein
MHEPSTRPHRPSGEHGVARPHHAAAREPIVHEAGGSEAIGVPDAQTRWHGPCVVRVLPHAGAAHPPSASDLGGIIFSPLTEWVVAAADTHDEGCVWGGGHVERIPLNYSDEKVENRDTKVWHLVMENGY